jgi:hypothetical protein
VAGSVLAWQGFRFEHPDDWAVSSVTGDRRSGYLRLNSSGTVSCQIRWQASKKEPDLRRRLESYFDLLRRDAKRGKVDFRSDVEADSNTLVYRWLGVGQGRGAILYCPNSRRVFFVEVSGRRKDSLLPELRRTLGAFQSHQGARLEEWSMFGLRLRAPASMRLERRRFLSGRTDLMLARPGLRIEAQRWALAEQLIARHGLENWARAALRLPGAVCTPSSEGLSFEVRRRIRLLAGDLRAFVSHDDAKNQITLLKVRWHTSRWEPTWEWLTEFVD